MEIIMNVDRPVLCPGSAPHTADTEMEKIFVRKTREQAVTFWDIRVPAAWQERSDEVMPFPELQTPQ